MMMSARFKQLCERKTYFRAGIGNICLLQDVLLALHHLLELSVLVVFRQLCAEKGRA